MAALPNLELKWLQDNGATSSVRMDAWKEMLELKGFFYTTFSDARRLFLESFGYTGTVQGMLNTFWQDCPSLEGTEWVDGEGWVDSQAWND